MFPYENPEVYKKAYASNQKVYRLLKGNKSIPGYARDQLGRASPKYNVEHCRRKREIQ